MKNFIECSFPLIDPENDNIDYINSQAINLKGSDLVDSNPGQYWFQKSTLGVKRLCTVRVDGEPMTITYTHSNTQDTKDVTDFPVSWVIGPHPHHTPGAPRPK